MQASFEGLKISSQASSAVLNEARASLADFKEEREKATNGLKSGYESSSRLYCMLIYFITQS